MLFLQDAAARAEEQRKLEEQQRRIADEVAVSVNFPAVVVLYCCCRRLCCRRRCCQLCVGVALRVQCAPSLRFSVHCRCIGCCVADVGPVPNS